ncbi:MAG TPA: L-carnitine dehydrogenase, partial [Pseudomonas sp.]|nr:L-carnitine dehydrogenase [Pseudomonas sp.]
RDADFIQESAPERLELKCELHAKISAAARPDVLIGSSTSGLLPSEFYADAVHPERCVVGHPFNPVYLLPLVEVVGGAKTAPEAVQAAIAVYQSLGMRPLHVRKEVPGFIADRLLEALWREALHLVNDGVATTGEIDDAIRFGAGLRWSFMGSFLTYTLAGGPAGMRHFMAQFGPALKLPWTYLEAPELTEALIDKVVEGTAEQQGTRQLPDLERYRDDCLLAVLAAIRETKAKHGFDFAE